jgi:hypothetical protein
MQNKKGKKSRVKTPIPAKNLTPAAIHFLHDLFCLGESLTFLFNINLSFCEYSSEALQQYF